MTPHDFDGLADAKALVRSAWRDAFSAPIAWSPPPKRSPGPLPRAEPSAVESIAAEVRRLAAEVAALRQSLEALAPAPLDRRHAELLAALAAVVHDATFTSAEALELAALALTDRRRLQAALQGAAATDAQRLGQVLALIARRTAGQHPRVVRAGRETGSALWLIEMGPAGA